MNDTNISVYRAIYNANKERLDAPALLAWGETVSYAELFHLADKTADILATAGVKAGDLILAQIHGTPESAALLLAASKLGIMVMMLNQQTSEQTLNLLCERFDTRFLFVMEKFFLTIADYSFIPLRAALVSGVFCFLHAGLLPPFLRTYDCSALPSFF